MSEGFDRAAVRAMVEDNFRATTIADLQGQGQLSYDINERFADRLEAMAALMLAVQAQSFTKTVNEECQFLLDECKRDPKAAYRRLGISLSRNPPGRYRRQGMGGLAVRTAVRATIWQTIFRLFR